MLKKVIKKIVSLFFGGIFCGIFAAFPLSIGGAKGAAVGFLLGQGIVFGGSILVLIYEVIYFTWIEKSKKPFIRAIDDFCSEI